MLAIERRRETVMNEKDRARARKLYLILEEALDLLHDMATDDPGNRDYRTGRLAAA